MTTEHDPPDKGASAGQKCKDQRVARKVRMRTKLFLNRRFLIAVLRLANVTVQIVRAMLSLF